jgi:hypothetical protein
MATLLMWLVLTAGSAETSRVAAQPISSASAIKLEGELSEEVWQKAPLVSGFRQRDPNEGAAATYETEARVAYDANAIYIAVRHWIPSPPASSASARAATSRRRRTGFA